MLTFSLLFAFTRDIAGRMRNQLYPMRLASYIDKNAQIIKDATVAGQSAMKSAQEATQVHTGNNWVDGIKKIGSQAKCCTRRLTSANQLLHSHH